MVNVTYSDFSGGLNYAISPIELGASQSKVYWEESKNIRLYKNNGITVMNGNTLIYEILDSETEEPYYIQGVYGLRVNLNEYLLAVANGTLYQFDGTDFNTIHSGLNAEEKVTFTVYGQGVIISDGITEPFIYFPERPETALGSVIVTNGSKTISGSGLGSLDIGDVVSINNETHIIETISPSVTTRENFSANYTGTNAKLTKVSYLCCNDIYLDFDAEGNPTGTQVTLRSKVIGTWGQRVFIGTPEGYHWSSVGTYRDWQTQYNAGYSYDIGKPILAINEFKGYLGLHHGVNNGASIISGLEDPQAWAVSKNYTDKGCSSPYGIITNEKTQYFIDIGIFAFSPNALGVIEIGQELSAPLRDRELGLLKGKYDLSRADEVVVAHNIALKELWWFIPLHGQDNFNEIYVFDYINNSWFRRVVPQNITCSTSFDNNIYVGTADGKILIEESGINFNGADLEFEFYSMFFNFGSQREKEIDEFNLIIDNLKDNNFNYSLRLNYDPNVILDTYTVGTSSVGTLYWNVGDWSENNWAVQNILSQTEQLYGSNTSFSLVFTGIRPMNLAIMGVEFRGISIDQ